MNQMLKGFISSYISVTDEQLHSFSTMFRQKSARRNEIILEAGNICRQMYFVNKGCLRIYLMDQRGKESTRFLIPEGAFGTAFPSFRLQEPSAAYIQAIEASELLIITYPEFMKLNEVLPGFDDLYRKELEKNYIASIKRIESLITMSARDRYASFIKENPGLATRLPSKIIADYLGILQETLSRLKAKI